MRNVIILIFVFFLLLNGVFAFVLLPTLEDFIRNSSKSSSTSICNYNSYCDFNESITTCPSDCIQKTNNQLNTNPASAIQQKNKIVVQQSLIQKRGLEGIFTKKVMLSVLSIIAVIALMTGLFLWINKSKKTGKSLGKKKEASQKAPFGLPQRPPRKFGLQK